MEPERQKEPPGVFVIELQSEPSDVPVAIRLRRALKVLLRSFGLRCTSVQEQKGEQHGQD